MRCTALFLTLCVLSSLSGKQDSPHIYNLIAPSYLATHPVNEEAPKTGLSLDIPQLGERKRAQLGFSVLQEDEERYGIKSQTTVVEPETWNNLELFANSFQKPDKTVVSALDRTTTTIGRLTLTKLLASPITDTALLKQRQAFLARLLSDDELFNSLSELLTRFSEHESSLLSLIQPNDPLRQEDLKNLFYTGTIFSKSPTAMSAQKHLDDALYLGLSTLCGLAILPAVFLVWYHSQRPEWAALTPGSKALAFTIPLALLGIMYLEYRDNKTMKDAYHYMRRRMQSGHHYLNIMKKVSKIDAQYNLSALHNSSETTAPKIHSETRQLHEYLASESFLSNRFFFAQSKPLFGAYPLLCKQASQLFHGIHLLGIIDAYLSMARLMKEHQEKPTTYSFVDYLSHDTPHIQATDFWHPSIPVDRAVTNNLNLGRSSPSHNTVITGINAGGKSTVMKALTLSLILGQTFGIAPSRSFAFTPFHKINTFLHITDDSSAGRSLFTAELYRARTLTEEIKALNPGEYSFTLLDEIFTATEYVEGEAGAYGVARRLADFPENITVLATHFQGLTSLEQTTVTANGPYRNMKVVVEVADDGSFVRDKEGKFVYPYTLIPGASDQHIALEILEERNFDRAVVAKARDVLAHPEKYTPTELDT